MLSIIFSDHEVERGGIAATHQSASVKDPPTTVDLQSDDEESGESASDSDSNTGSESDSDSESGSDSEDKVTAEAPPKPSPMDVESDSSDDDEVNEIPGSASTATPANVLMTSPAHRVFNSMQDMMREAAPSREALRDWLAGLPLSITAAAEHHPGPVPFGCSFLARKVICLPSPSAHRPNSLPTLRRPGRSTRHGLHLCDAGYHTGHIVSHWRRGSFVGWVVMFFSSR